MTGKTLQVANIGQKSIEHHTSYDMNERAIAPDE
jgi:hypothetical protein